MIIEEQLSKLFNIVKDLNDRIKVLEAQARELDDSDNHAYDYDPNWD